MNDSVLCPFSKPIIGDWCQCQHANLAERCSGKMSCKKASLYLSGCMKLVSELKENSRFVLALSDTETELTHAQTMKIRCGGLLGMQRLVFNNQQRPDVLQLIAAITSQYGSTDKFPFNAIMPDIKAFSHRSKKKR